MLALARARSCARTLASCPTSRRYVSTGAGEHNAAIIDFLKQNMKEENASPTRNEYKVRAFDSAIKAISRLDYPIRSSVEASALKGVGPGITRRIAAFLSEKYGITEPPSKTRVKDESRIALSTLQSVPGVGPIMAKKLFDAGCKSLADMQKPRYHKMLRPTMQVGLKYLDYIREPVTSEQAETVLSFIHANISPKFFAQLVGSYRRKVETYSDIDIVLLHPHYVYVPTPSLPTPPPIDISIHRKGRSSIPFRERPGSAAGRSTSLLVQDVVTVLEERGLIAATMLSTPRKWQGIVRVPEGMAGHTWYRREQIRLTQGQYRRMNMTLVPSKSKGAALLALTGDAEFLRHLKIKAAGIGMLLDEFGLWRWQANDILANDSATSANGFWELANSDTEEEILEELGMGYVPPEKRNFVFTVGRRSTKSRNKLKI